MTSKEWDKIGPFNCILKGNNFYISFADTSSMGFFSGDGDGLETALVRDGVYLILNGDHRKEYEELIDNGFDECEKYFNENKNLLQSFWSN